MKLNYQVAVQAGFGAIKLLREGDSITVYFEVRKNLWVKLIDEYFDNPISHIVEPEGINRAIEKSLQ